MKPTREEKLSDAFLVLGSQYYAHARYSVQFYYLPVSVTLFHHAIEMLLKGYLSRVKTLDELRKLGHDLEALWGAFKTLITDNSLNRFDSTISKLNGVESLRYPEEMVNKGYVLSVRFGPVVPMHLPGLEKLPRYSVDIHELDEIASEILIACGVNASVYFKNAPTVFKDTLPTKLQPRE